ncbi:MAG: L-seryl-tRNA(Sec) selenium transferase [Bryobacteraceae bacterium]|nr:L-seryl-tRNA(Sec) selenium transferase [Bryobacteraceae bacterium]
MAATPSKAGNPPVPRAIFLRPSPKSKSLVDLSALPSVDQLLGRLALPPGRFPHGLVVAQIRQTLQTAREALRAGQPAPDLVEAVRARLLALEAPSLRRVINATGVVLHTNLGRAALAGFTPLDGYSNLEYDLAQGRRGKRDLHYSHLLQHLLGVPAIAVNNNAAATYLVLQELAAGHEVIVSRGELIEIGDGFRIPDIMERSGAILREVGTTNRTTLEDYRRAINERTRLILRVHPSNFHVSGFTQKPALADLSTLGVPVYEDLGSGCLVDLRPYGISEPLVGESLAAGVALVSFSCDKLLGGPQTGIIAGDPALVERCRRNPMYRAFRPDKLIVQALEHTLRLLLLERYDEVPTLRMIRASAAELRQRAEAFAAQVEGAVAVAGESVAGGGSTPDQTLPAWLVRLPGPAHKLERQLRGHATPIIARIESGAVVLDLRTVAPADEAIILAALVT